MANLFKRYYERYIAVQPAVSTETRSLEAPQKVFVQQEGPYYEYSDTEPPGVRNRVHDLINGLYSSQNFIELFTCLPEVFAPVHEIASRVSDAVWELRKEWNDEIDYKNEYFNKLFSQPNPFMAMKQHIYQAVCYEILTGRQLFYFNRSKLLGEGIEGVFTWSNLDASTRAEKVKGVDPYTITDLKEFIKFWYNRNANGQVRKFDTEDVLQFLNYDLDGRKQYDPNCVKALIKGAEKAISNLIPVYEARGVIYIKRGALGFMVSKKGDASGLVSLTRLEKEDARREMDNTYGLTGGKATVGITDAPLEFIRTALSIAELQPFDETAADALAIYKVLRVPRHLAPLKDNSTFSNADADMKSFYGDVIIPWAVRYAEAFTNFFKIDRHYIVADYSHVPALQVNQKEESAVNKTIAETWVMKFKNGMCSLNEAIVGMDGTPGSGPIYEDKIFELSPEDQDTVIKILKLQPDAPQNNNAASPQNQNAGGGN